MWCISGLSEVTGLERRIQEQAISDKTGDKYRWHDLRKNPTDIPKDSGDYLCCVEFREEYYSEKLENEYCVVEWYNGKWYTGETIYYGIDVIAWKEIEPFEVTE